MGWAKRRGRAAEPSLDRGAAQRGLLGVAWAGDACRPLAVEVAEAKADLWREWHGKRLSAMGSRRGAGHIRDSMQHADHRGPALEAPGAAGAALLCSLQAGCGKLGCTWAAAAVPAHSIFAASIDTARTRDAAGAGAFST